jgi:hypothetical protein
MKDDRMILATLVCRNVWIGPKRWVWLLGHCQAHLYTQVCEESRVDAGSCRSNAATGLPREQKNPLSKIRFHILMLQISLFSLSSSGLITDILRTERSWDTHKLPYANSPIAHFHPIDDTTNPSLTTRSMSSTYICISCDFSISFRNDT